MVKSATHFLLSNLVIYHTNLSGVVHFLFEIGAQINKDEIKFVLKANFGKFKSTVVNSIMTVVNLRSFKLTVKLMIGEFCKSFSSECLWWR